MMITKRYRQLIQATDPCVDITIPQALYASLQAFAVKNARDFKSELLARLSQSLKYHTEQFAAEEMMQGILVKARACVHS